MAREKVGDDVMKVRFGDGTFDRIDAVSGNRSEFIRGAVEAALGGAYEPVKKIDMPASEPVETHTLPVPQKKNSIVPSPKVGKAYTKPVSPRAADIEALRALIGEKRLTSRQAEQAMGWLGLRYANAEKGLLQSGGVAGRAIPFGVGSS